MDDYEWEVLRSNVQRFHEEGEFIAFLGYEWTVSTRVGGHHNVLFRTPEGESAFLFRVPLFYLSFTTAWPRKTIRRTC